jgi:signal transduction histidine kinase/CheY-like chemotaxis protein
MAWKNTILTPCICTLEMKNKATGQVHDIKEVSKRAMQLVTSALVIAMISLIMNLIQGYIYSTVITIAFCIFFGIILFLHKKGFHRYTKLSTIVGINFFLFLFALVEGLNSGSFLYFFALIFAIPFLINNNRKYDREVVFYFFLSSLLFAICIFFVPGKSNWQAISDEDCKAMYKINSLCTIVLCAVFAYLSIHFERKYAAALIEEKLRTEYAMQAKSQFLSHMGHELRTPLNGIIGATNLLDKKTILQEQQEEFSILKYCSSHMLELINNILDYNKIEAGKLELHPVSINLKQLLQTSTLPFYNRFEEKKVDLRVSVDEQLNEQIMVDDIRLIQIINNLLSNALKFTESGFVELKAECLEQSAGEMQILFSVKDTGIGIKEENINKVFASFEQVYSESTRQYGGTGLGISICQRLLQLMESELKVHTKYGEGSCFYFSVQFKKAPITKKHETIVQETADLKGMNILIAEDNLINMMIAKKTLGEWNVNLTAVENGALALEALQINPEVDLVLLDLEMPVMDGYVAVKEIKLRYPHLPVLAFTAALIDNQMYSSLKALGFEDAVLKPFQPMELFSKIRKYCGLRSENVNLLSTSVSIESR